MKVLLISTLLLATSCSEQVQTLDSKQAAQTELLLSEANRQVGMPNITNFTERKLMKTILELRDQDGLRTWTYIVDMHGELHFLTESIGYGLPYSVQYTNPERLTIETVDSPIMGERYRIVDGALPQADPNGLFMPTGLAATWIIAATDNGPRPIYVEPEILVSPFPMPNVEH